MLRLHSTYRHDLKVRASDEGRVMKTAAAFTKGLLELEGHLQPILNSLVTVEEKNRQLLDRGGNMEDILQEDMDRCLNHLNLSSYHLISISIIFLIAIIAIIATIATITIISIISTISIITPQV